MTGYEKSQCLSSRGIREESETHPDNIPSAIIEGVMRILNMGAFFLGHPVYICGTDFFVSNKKCSVFVSNYANLLLQNHHLTAVEILCESFLGF